MPKNIHQSWFQSEILCTTSDRDEKVWPFHFPLFPHYVVKLANINVRLNPNILQNTAVKYAVFVIREVQQA